MARHPEVTEKAIIQAGKQLEAEGKIPNPGSIRAHLGFRGGLARIKSVWETHQQENGVSHPSGGLTELSFDALPESFAEQAKQLMTSVDNALEQLVVNAYGYGQRMFEQRIATLEKEYDSKLMVFAQAETDADRCIQRLESELRDVQSEANKLAKQNASLLIENSELRGRLAVFDERFTPPSKSSVNGGDAHA